LNITISYFLNYLY